MQGGSMPEWLSVSLASNTTASAGLLAWRIGAALALGGAVAGLYRWSRRGESIPPTFATTLILLSALIAMATQVIGDNIARAFSLVGALSVVRFRTVVKDTQDTAFVIFAVVVGMAAGSNNLAVALIGLALLAASAPALWPLRRPGGWSGIDATLSLRISLADGVQATTEALIAASARRFELISVGTGRKGTVIDLTYRVRLRPDASPAALLAALNASEEIESAELRRDD